MVIIVIYGLFSLYIIVRICLSYAYYLAKKKHSTLFYKRENELYAKEEFPELEGNQINLEQLKKEWDEMPITKQIAIAGNKCRKLYLVDVCLKRIGSIVLSILSLIGLWIDFQNEFQLSSLYLAMLPSIVNLFNSFFEWFEIQLDIGFQQAVPQKFK